MFSFHFFPTNFPKTVRKLEDLFELFHLKKFLTGNNWTSWVRILFLIYVRSESGSWSFFGQNLVSFCLKICEISVNCPRAINLRNSAPKCTSHPTGVEWTNHSSRGYGPRTWRTVEPWRGCKYPLVRQTWFSPFPWREWPRSAWWRPL